MSKFSAYARLFRVPAMGALGIVSVMLFSIAELLSANLLIGIPIAWYVFSPFLLKDDYSS